MHHPKIINAITLSGTLPMIGLAIAIAYEASPWASELLATYVFAIVIFMLGTLWGEAKDQLIVVIGGNLLFMLALTCFILLPLLLWLAAAAIILLVTLGLEIKNISLSAEYVKLRLIVTTTTVIILMASSVFLYLFTAAHIHQ